MFLFYCGNDNVPGKWLFFPWLAVVVEEVVESAKGFLDRFLAVCKGRSGEEASEETDASEFGGEVIWQIGVVDKLWRVGRSVVLVLSIVVTVALLAAAAGIFAFAGGFGGRPGRLGDGRKELFDDKLDHVAPVLLKRRRRTHHNLCKCGKCRAQFGP